MSEDVIKVGQYIVIQKQSYKKLLKFNKPNVSVTLGKDCVNLNGIEGYPFFSVFRMIPSSKKGREYKIEYTEEAVELKNEIDVKASGTDNRNIVDDGKSQKLSATEIAELANDATKASDIVETLISNSNTFHNKTEFSQDKYLRKKEKKYFEYIQILKPNLRLVSEIMFRLDPGKIQNLRSDTLSQIMTMSNIHCEGVHLLYDSGSNGLLAAALLSAIGAETNAKLLHMHPGNMSQKQALLAMNFKEEQYNRCISVNIYSALRQYYQGVDTHEKDTGTDIPMEDDGNCGDNPLKRKADKNDEHKNKIAKTDERKSNEDHCDSENSTNTNETTGIAENITVDNEKLDQENKVTEIRSNDTETAKTEDNVTENITHKKEEENSENKQSEPKKPKWHFDNIAAADLLKEKVDSLVIACKEDPLDIIEELLQFMKPGRPFVVYYPVAEPLQHLYLELKSNPKVAALKLTCNWMRNYQVLPERTHPEVMMNNQSGFLLSGYVLK